MNIKEAKEQIKNAMKAYFAKDEFGEYVIPIEKQRPIFLVGAPGIGKTAIMEQISSELGVGLVSYSMTHHTRQSALGLPFIAKKTYGGKVYTVSEYTMSEIIASVYDMTEATGNKEGILFLDEINCVSETLAPSMLQFLQYKIFGRHRVPEGWIVVTAGNPPEYNNSVREFDVVTSDRLKRINVEPDYDVWKEYAINRGAHPSIITYLDLKKNNFYKIESSTEGKKFVTARGWTDLSDMIKLYEKQGTPVDIKLIEQYLQNDRIARDFAVYYDLFVKYRTDYRIDEILNGGATDVTVGRAIAARFDERLAFIGMLLSGVYERLSLVCRTESALAKLLDDIKGYRVIISRPGCDYAKELEGMRDRHAAELERGRVSSSISLFDQKVLLETMASLEELYSLISEKAPANASDVFALIRTEYDAKHRSFRNMTASAGRALSNAFAFLEKAYGDGQEMLVFVTELTVNLDSARFISRYGCAEYFAHNKELMFYERQKELIKQIEDLDLD